MAARSLEVRVVAALLVGVWVTTLSSVATSDMAAAAGSALLCALAAVAARRAVEGAWRPYLRWAGWLLRLPAAVVLDTFRVLGVAVRHFGHRSRSVGRIERIELPHDADRSRARARAALGTMTLSAAPGSFVFEVEEDQRVLVLHALVRTVPSTSRQVSA